MRLEANWNNECEAKGWEMFPISHHWTGDESHDECKLIWIKTNSFWCGILSAISPLRSEAMPRTVACRLKYYIMSLSTSIKFWVRLTTLTLMQHEMWRWHCWWLFPLFLQCFDNISRRLSNPTKTWCPFFPFLWITKQPGQTIRATTQF